MTETQPQEKVRTIINTVYGMDIHPLAILISKANYLMSIGDALKKKGGLDIVIPIYLADSITFPIPRRKIATFGVSDTEESYLYNIDNRTELAIPKTLVEDKSFDILIDVIKEEAIAKANGNEKPPDGFYNFLKLKFRTTRGQFDIITDTIEKLSNLIKNNQDNIYTFILKNIYKPNVIGKFEVVIGNPPWLPYRDIKSIDRQLKLKEMITKEYRLLDSSSEELLTHMELATLFFVRCADLYLKEHGK
jgi:hypothetical protein